jgi:hypothetical protein
MPGGAEVNDGEAAVREPYTGGVVTPGARVVRPTVGDGLPHAAQMRVGFLCVE